MALQCWKCKRQEGFPPKRLSMHRRIANKAKEMEVLQINYKTILREGNTCSKLPGPHRICAFAALTGRLCCSCREEKAFL